jgi:uncharacterized protein
MASGSFPSPTWFNGVVVTVLFTSLAGIVLCWLRLRSGSLLVPMLAHWTVNGLGAIVALLA